MVPFAEGMMELKYPEWQKPYRAALEEFNPIKFSSLVLETETAMFLRLQELAASSDGHEEKQAIADASHELFSIKRDIFKS